MVTGPSGDDSVEDGYPGGAEQMAQDTQNNPNFSCGGQGKILTVIYNHGTF